jgi:hypothetical protein
VTDALSGVAHFEIQSRLNSNTWTDWSVQNANQSTFRASSDGTYTFRIRATDLLGNTNPEWLESSSVTVDTLPPTVTLSVQRQDSTTYLISWAGVDANQPLTYTFQYHKQGDTDWITATHSNATSWTLPATFGSVYEVRINAADPAGNVSAWVTKTISAPKRRSLSPITKILPLRRVMRQCCLP